MMDWHDWSSGAWVMMAIMMIGFWGLVAWIIYTLARGTSQLHEDGQDTPSAEDILSERFARGEIDADEYRDRRNALRSSH